MGPICPHQQEITTHYQYDTEIAEETAINQSNYVFTGNFMETLELQFKTERKRVYTDSEHKSSTIDMFQMDKNLLNSSQSTKKGILKNTNTHLKEELILLTKTIRFNEDHHSCDKLAKYLKARKCHCQQET